MAVKIFGERNRSNEKNNFGKNEGDGVGPSEETGDDIFEDDKEEKNQRSGLQIDFTDNELIEDIKGYKIKSRIKTHPDRTKTILIYQKHPDFDKRLDKSSRKREVKITARLINYLAGQLAIYCRDEYYKKTKQQPEVNQDLFTDIVDLICEIESGLSEYVGHPINTISSNE